MQNVKSEVVEVAEYHWEVIMSGFWMYAIQGSENFNASMTDMLGFGKIEHASGGALRLAMGTVDSKTPVSGQSNTVREVRKYT